MRIRRQFIRKEAENLLQMYAPSAIPVPVETIAKRLGYEIRFVDEDSEMSGFLMRNKSSVIIGVNKNHSSNRQRFTIAHEIGHGMLHSSEALYVDKRFRNELSSQGTNAEEMEANLFAAELLMPASQIRKSLKAIGNLDVESDFEIDDLANKYKVSRLAMSNRLTYLGHLCS
ncbi:MAG: ImmA/IrrE family metallo-endopeptidase [Armatimonadetes bacterium]|nr:ImmA/IrrE family metallo-endopeptidase [Akkermansiaceae bacterium]